MIHEVEHRCFQLLAFNLNSEVRGLVLVVVLVLEKLDIPP
jgi:hypothetical protein